MYSFSQATFSRGMERGKTEGIEIGKNEGIEIGVERGKHEGILQATINYIRNIMSINDINEESAMDLLGVENELRPIVLEKLSKKHNN